jgi:hypothetical protein
MTRIPQTSPRIIGTVLTDTAQTTLYTASTNSSTIAIPSDIHVTNVTAVAANITLEYSITTGGTVYTLVYRYPVQPNGTGLHLSDDDGLGFQLAAGGTIRATAGTANALHVSLSVIEIAGRSAG